MSAIALSAYILELSNDPGGAALGFLHVYATAKEIEAVIKYLFVDEERADISARANSSTAAR